MFDVGANHRYLQATKMLMVLRPGVSPDNPCASQHLRVVKAATSLAADALKRTDAIPAMSPESLLQGW